ncbi:hypothetical protein RV10_GL005007 [Enterococcus pallens]|nr:hypothetical protein RV10_GL005007 [Enterococcus pallens]
MLVKKITNDNKKICIFPTAIRDFFEHSFDSSVLLHMKIVPSTIYCELLINVFC